MMVASIASDLIWKLMFYDNNGVINWFLNGLGLESVGWFSDRGAARAAVLIASLWGSLPFAVLTLLAALQGIPDEYVEAAVIDGAKRLETFLAYHSAPAAGYRFDDSDYPRIGCL